MSFSTRPLAISAEHPKLNALVPSVVRSFLHNYDDYVREVAQCFGHLTDTTSDGNFSKSATGTGRHMSLKFCIDQETLRQQFI